MGKFFARVGDGLTLYVKHVAWLHARPRIKSGKADKPGDRSRDEQMRAAGQTPALPPLLAGEHVIGHLFDAGPVLHTGMGPVPLSWSELATWQTVTGIELTPWEAQTVRRLSAEYVTTQQAAEDPGMPPPYMTAPTADQRARVAADLRSVLGGMARKQKR